MMTAQTTIGQGKQGVQGVLVMTGATVALVGGLALWQLRPVDEASHRGTTEQHQPQQMIAEASSLQVSSSTQLATGSALIAEYIYLVDSEEQAAVVRRLSAEFNSTEMLVGRPAPVSSALVVPGIERSFLTGMAEQPGVRVVDMRTP